MDRPVRFHPTDEQLFAHFLVGKATGAPLPPNPIEERDIYSQEPQEIFDAASDRTFYVFTTLRKNKSRVLRTAGSGTWKEQHSSKITNGDGELIGHKKSFKFKGGQGSSATNGRWIMYEFSMCDEQQCKYVLCKIKYHKDEKKSGEKAIVISDDSPERFEDVDQARAAASRAVGSGVMYAEPLRMSTVAAATLHLDTDDPGFSGFGSDANANSHLPMATATLKQSSNVTLSPLFTTAKAGAVRRDIRCASYSPAFGCNRGADVLPAITTSAQVDTGNTT
ncbi:NAC domain-containing protein 41-like [Rhodamnia argentea]|uniref:NAC domain-containing protein 41-like n=1 Tax=Rhodamnia argentea TaxID=178133 RepID=A0ABM3H4X8_9MYRT|nr:NAC domain-containing protein 41-like [Rhodamnia argentea]